MTGATSRRDALGRGLAIAGATVAAGAGARLLRVPDAAAKTEGDMETLERLIELEHRSAAAYRTLAEGDLLDAEVRAAAELFAGQEREHAEALSAALEELGGSPPKPPRAADVEGLDDLDSQAGALKLAIELEDQLVRAYDDAAETFATFDLLKTCSQIVANEGQHLVVLREQLGRDPVPEAFESGTGDD